MEGLIEYIVKVVKFVIELFVLGTPLFIIVCSMTLPFMYYQHYLDCKKYPHLYTMRIWE